MKARFAAQKADAEHEIAMLSTALEDAGSTIEVRDTEIARLNRLLTAKD